ncbi:hypothetical protein KEM48_006786 [Puccinia striiformis f. sp. tritici PST-130]|uniref:Uncharacterized protein n=1 Tax=Puccinia striiformis f. sp. tritici PST-78 TaxID=1165861 RepID=A0A0L0W2Z3_9BASI|nr:hypothetical protein KEM48_006786 [Puccinia striiformis f. sp. tritici PST-130]KNF05869.1 hypothetical protein PSTG_00863 [Puccinia striiformis f. sp. tritici PST-78]
MSEPLVPGPDDSLIFNVLERERANSDLVSQTRKVPPYVVIIPRAASGSLAHRRIGLITFYGQLTVIDHVIRVEARVAHWSSQPPFGFNDHHICGPIVSGLWSMRTLMPWGITAEEEMKFYGRREAESEDREIDIRTLFQLLTSLDYSFMTSL